MPSIARTPLLTRRQRESTSNWRKGFASPKSIRSSLRQPNLPTISAPAAAASSLRRCGSRKSPSRLKSFLKISGLHAVGPADALIATAAVACGSGGSFLEHAIRQDVDLLVTGETSFHTCLEAEARGVHLLLAGHFATERFAVAKLAEVLASEFPRLKVWASEQETDPLRWMT